MNISRRLFIVRSAALAFTLYAAPSFKKIRFRWESCRAIRPPMSLFVLWTRLAPDPVNGGGMDHTAMEVEWPVAEDEALRKVVKKGKATACPCSPIPHVEVRGLKSHRPYLVSLQSGQRNQSGWPRPHHTQARRTAGELKFAFASCQHWEAGLVDRLQAHARRQSGAGRAPGRLHLRGARRQTACASTTAPKSSRWRTTATATALQDRRGAPGGARHCPWIVTWDDHEVDNNYASDVRKTSGPRRNSSAPAPAPTRRTTSTCRCVCRRYPGARR